MRSPTTRSTRLVRSFHRRTPTSGNSTAANFSPRSWARSQPTTAERFAPIFRTRARQASRFRDDVSTLPKRPIASSCDKNWRLRTLPPCILRDNIPRFWGWNTRFAAAVEPWPLLYRALCHSDYSKAGRLSAHYDTFVGEPGFLLLLLFRKEFLRESEGVRKR